MYIIQADGYNIKDKNEIVKGFLLPKAMHEFGLTVGNIVIPEETIKHIVLTYTEKEEGVRNLKRCVETILSKINMYRLTGGVDASEFPSLEFPITVGCKEADYLLKSSNGQRVNDSHYAMYN
jgi:ATP-dependent Lon protease